MTFPLKERVLYAMQEECYRFYRNQKFWKGISGILNYWGYFVECCQLGYLEPTLFQEPIGMCRQTLLHLACEAMTWEPKGSDVFLDYNDMTRVALDLLFVIKINPNQKIEGGGDGIDGRTPLHFLVENEAHFLYLKKKYPNKYPYNNSDTRSRASCVLCNEAPTSLYGEKMKFDIPDAQGITPYQLAKMYNIDWMCRYFESKGAK